MVQNIQKKILTKNKVILLNDFEKVPFTFDLDQIKVAEQAFSQGFLVSVEASKEEEKNAEEVMSTMKDMMEKAVKLDIPLISKEWEYLNVSNHNRKI